MQAEEVPETLGEETNIHKHSGRVTASIKSNRICFFFLGTTIDLQLSDAGCGT